MGFVGLIMFFLKLLFFNFKEWFFNDWKKYVMILFIYLVIGGGGEVYIYIKIVKFYVENGLGSGWLVVFSRGLWYKVILLVICR